MSGRKITREEALSISRQVLADAENARTEPAPPPAEVCEWTLKVFYSESSCGHRASGRDRFNRDYKYCSYCGKPIKIVEAK